MIEVKNLSKTYDNGINALTDVSFDIIGNEIVGIIGRNGAGKSTLFKILCGIIEDYEGASLMLGHKSSINLANQFSYIPEVRGLDQRMYVMEHLIDLVRYKGMGKREAKENVIKLLKKFSLYSYKFQKISSLSKGNQQKLQLIVAMASNPKILILDEPFSGLDLITVDFFWEILIELREKGCTILFSTHDLNDNIFNCNQFIFLHQGKIVESGSIQDIQKNFDMILELKNQSTSLSQLKGINGIHHITENNGEYRIHIRDKEVARHIFNNLEDKYCEKFFLRAMSIPEIYRELCR